MPDTSKLEKINRELEKSEKKLRKAINDTQDIRKFMEAFKSSMEDETFDKYFEKYIRMNQL